MQSVISQREIGSDTASYSAALRAVLREDPDIILVGEMRDLETIQTALTAAETGHLVFATLHTKSAADSIDRMVDVFPEGLQRQIRMQLSTTLEAVLSQQLLPRSDKRGRVLACELMMVTPAIRNLIREGKTPQIASSMATSAAAGSVTMDNALIALNRARLIDAHVAREASIDHDYVEKNTN
jgi:twitching motility protein PilT